MLCDRQEIPDGYAPYRRTPLFTNDSIPQGLRARHTTKTGVWGKIHVLSGSLMYRIHDPYHTEIILDRDRQGIVLPEVEHEVEPIDNVEFFVEFWKKV